MSEKKIPEKKIPSQQRFIFKLLTGLIPFIILLIFEVLLRVAGYGDNMNLFVKNPIEGYDKYMIVNPTIGKKYFQKFEYTAPPNDIFLTDKSENTFRIFVMGSSTVFGFPYERNLMFSRILHQQLEDAYPNKKIEFVNTAITAINSFTLLDFTDEILKYKPDAILIYAGHNEFYGAFGIGSNETLSRNRGLTQMHIALMDFKIYQLIRNLVAGVSKTIASNKKNEVHGTLMKRMVADRDILLDSEEYKIAMERYRQNMNEILKKIQKKNVPVFFSEVVSNVKGLKPFNSVPTEKMEGANEVFEKAQEAEENGDFEKAWELYCKAKDLDCIRFRASEDVNKIINDLADKYNVYKIPMQSWFQSNSPNKLIGNNLMTEHVHPNIDGNFLMAEAFRKEIIKSSVIGKQNVDPGYSMEYRKRNWGYTALDSLLGHQRVQLLKGFWPFVLDEKNEYDFQRVYQPKSYLDSLVFSVMKDPDLTLSDIRLKLAQKYEKEGDNYMAFKEYDALLRSNPYIAINYRDAANSLLQMSDLPKALKYFRKSLEYEESGFAIFKMGEIYFFMGDYKNAIQSFEKSFPLIPDDKKIVVLTKAYVACIYDNDMAKAQSIAKEIKRVKASQYFNAPPKKYTFNDYIPFQTREQVITAKQFMRESKNKEALSLLESSLQIYDSHIANRLIGEIYMKQQNTEKAFQYYSKVYNQFKFDVGFLHNCIFVYIAKNDIVNARKCLDEIKQIEPGYEHLGLLNSLLSSTK